MKTQAPFTCMLLLISLICMQCKKEDSKKKNELPAATQEGKNTFGFILNGEIWVPQGGILDQRLDITYDPSYLNGSLGVYANRYISNEDKVEIGIGGTGINKVGTYNFETSSRNIYFRDFQNNCDYLENTKISGSITVTRLDLSAKIISGTFHFKLEKDGCKTIDATDGRFDIMIEE